jgi:hypothetical protein
MAKAAKRQVMAAMTFMLTKAKSRVVLEIVCLLSELSGDEERVFRGRFGGKLGPLYTSSLSLPLGSHLFTHCLSPSLARLATRSLPRLFSSTIKWRGELPS